MCDGLAAAGGPGTRYPRHAAARATLVAMDEDAIRGLIAGLTTPEGSPLLQVDQVTGITIEPDYVVIALTEQQVPRSTLSRIHAHVSAALPGREIELRGGGRVFRGGFGFGDKRHVIAVLGGK